MKGSLKRVRGNSKLQLERLEDRLYFAVSPFFAFDSIASVGQAGLTGIHPGASVNERGEVAFVGDVTGGQSIFISDGASGLTNISPNLVNESRTFGQVQINDSGKVGAEDRINLTSVFTNARSWIGASAANINFVNAHGVTPPSAILPDYFDILAAQTSFNNDGKIAFGALRGNTWEIYLSDTFVDPRTPPPVVTTIPTGTVFRLKAADNDNVVVTARRTGVGASINLYGPNAQLIAATGSQWSEIGLGTGVSDDGSLIAFYGNLTASGARDLTRQQGVEITPGPGIFVSVKLGASRAIIRVAGEIGSGYTDPGERRLTSGQDAGPDFDYDQNADWAIGTIVQDGLIGVERSGPDYANVVYVASDALTGNKAIFESRVNFYPTTAGVEAYALVAETGRGGFSFPATDFTLYDALNNTGQIAFSATDGTNQAIFLAKETNQHPNRVDQISGTARFKPDSPLVEYVVAGPIGTQARTIPNEIILHATGGFERINITQDFAINNAASKSVHYLISREGRVTQIVPEAQTANHATPANANSIGIEFVDNGRSLTDQNWATDIQLKKAALLVRDIADRNNIDKTHLTTSNTAGIYETTVPQEIGRTPARNGIGTNPPSTGVLAHGQVLNRTAGRSDPMNFPSGAASPGTTYQWSSFMTQVNGSLSLELRGGANLLLTDPLGRQVGIDPSTGQLVNQIAGAIINRIGDVLQLILNSGFFGVYGMQLWRPPSFLNAVSDADSATTVAAGAVLEILASDAGGSIRTILGPGDVATGSMESFNFEYSGSDVRNSVLSAAMNLLPTALDDFAFTNQDVPVPIDLLRNDSDPENMLAVNTIAMLVAPQHGTVGFDPLSGLATYTPTTGYFGPDSFQYSVQDAAGGTSNAATVALTITANTIAPQANDDTATTLPGVPVTITVLSNDHDPDGTIDPTTIEIAEFGDPANGDIDIDLATGAIVYSPASGFVGTDSIKYTVRDNHGARSNEGTVTVTVGADVPNTPPLANDETGVTTTQQTPVVIDVLTNDSDNDGTLNPSSVTVVAPPPSGAATSVDPATGAITYAPLPGFVGTESFTYTVQDNGGATSNVATVTVTVEAPSLSGAIHGFKWNDLDGDSAWDQGESGLDGWTIELLQNGQVIATTTTGDDPATPQTELGAYGFTGLSAGIYTVREVLQQGWQQSFPGGTGEHELTLAAGEIIAGAFGVTETAPPSSGMQIALHSGSNDPETEGWSKFRSFTNVATLPVVNDLGTGINAWSVDDNGNADGFYGQNFTSQQISDALAVGWKMSARLRVVDFRQFESGQSAIDVQFSIPSRVFGLRLGQESDGSPLVTVQGTPGVVDLDDLDNGYHLYEMVYDPLSDKADLYVDGILRLSDIAGDAGTAVPEANLLFGSRLANGEGDGQGQANYNSVSFTIFSETAAPNFGNQLIPTPVLNEIHGFKWNDLDGDGAWDDGGPGANGWTIELLQNDQVIASTVTGDDPATAETEAGAYGFTGLSAGTYTVREVPQQGWQQTSPSAGSYTLTLGASGVATVKNIATGIVDATGEKIPGGQPDPDYVIAPGGTGGHIGETPMAMTLIPLSFQTDDASAGSRWLGLAGSGLEGASVARGTYVHQIHVDLTGFDPATAVLEGLRAAFDDRLLSVSINGQVVVDSPPNSDPSKFFLDLGNVGLGAFQAGTNIIQFIVDNEPSFATVMALRVEGNVRAESIASQIVAGRFGVAETPNFGNQLIPIPPAEIHGFKWDDADGDGTWDAGEPGLSGWTIELVQDGQVIASTLTGDDPATAEVEIGAYGFTGLAAGTYTVREVPQQGWQQTYPGESGEHLVVLAASQILTGASGTAESPNFGNRLIPIPLAEIHGFKWSDLDGDSVWDQGEPGLNGWTIELVQDGQVIASTVTGDDPTTPETEIGAYAFTGLDAGTYTVREVLQTGWQQTYSGSGGQHQLVLATSQIVSGVFGTAAAPNFGNRLTPPVGDSVIRGYKWNDLDGDGVWDEVEPALSGWTIQLVRDGQIVAETVTGDDPTTPKVEVGIYRFAGLTAGTYTVREVQQGGWQQTFPSSSAGHQLTLAEHQVLSGRVGGSRVPNFGNQLAPGIRQNLKGFNGAGNDCDLRPSGNPQINDGPDTSPGNPGNKGAAPEKGNANGPVKNGVATGLTSAAITTSNEKPNKKDQALPISTSLGGLMPATVDLLMADIGRSAIPIKS